MKKFKRIGSSFELRDIAKPVRYFLEARSSKLEAQPRGFTLLMAALVVSVVLAMGASIYSLVSKQVALVGMTRDSRYAFYAADTGAECALYWDIRDNYFASTTPSGVTPFCNGTYVTVASVPAGQSSPYTYPYTLEFSYNYYGNCADVSVTKTLNGGVVNSVIHADGYSTTCATRATSVRSLQRSVEISY